MNIQSGRSKEFSVQGKKLIGFNFAVFIKHGTSNTDLAVTDFLPENILLSLKLMRGGKTYPLLPQANLKVMHLATNFYNGSYESSMVSSSAAKVLVEKGVGIFEQWLFPMSFKLHGPIDLQGNDKVILTVNFQPTGVSANVSTADSYLELTEITDQFRYETFTPTFEVVDIQQTESKIERHFANLSDLKFINTDKTGILTADALIAQANFVSKMLAYNMTYNDMLSRRSASFSDGAEADARKQSFDLYDGDIAPDANLTLSFNSANVNANKNFLVAFTAFQDARLVSLADARQTKHQGKKLLRAGVNFGKQVANAQAAETALTV